MSRIVGSSSTIRTCVRAVVSPTASSGDRSMGLVPQPADQISMEPILLRLSGQAPPSSMLRAGTGSVCEIPHSSWSFAVPSLTRRPFAIEALNDAGPTGGRSARSATCWRNAQRLRPTLPWCRCSPRLCRIPSKSWPLGTGCHRCRCFHINLYLPQVGASDIAVELARHIRQQFSARYRRAA